MMRGMIEMSSSEAVNETVKRDGVSLRTIHFWLIVGSVMLCGLMFYSTFHLSSSFKHLTETNEQQIELTNAAQELMDASDFLTERVQRFTVKGDRRFLDEYFNEALTAHHREEAIERMGKGQGTNTAYQKLEAAMDMSVKLMDTEYYAMRLVIAAKGITDYPDVLQDVTLTAEDAALDSKQKMDLATELVLNDAYYEQKDKIRENMKESLSELEQMAYNADAAALESLRGEMTFVRFVIILQTIGIIFMVWLTSRLGIHPVLNAVDRIKSDSPIPEVGANEFRYLARAYNKMYEVYKNSLARLNFKASHDELTGAYNRAGYDLLLSSIDLNSTYMMLFDVDNFKTINDTYGHEIGDKALIKLVKVLRSNFRSDDYICRIGGDEFVVFMVHTAEMQHNLLAQKMDEINRELAETDDGVPAISISVGIMDGKDAADTETLYKKADEAMYESKKNGKHTYTFYHGK